MSCIHCLRNRIGHDVCGNYPSFTMNKTCEYSILMAFDDMHKLKMNFEKYRLKSFKNFPKNYVNVKELAINGFYYTGEDDIVKCNFCDIKMYKWQPDDIVSIDHLKASIDCPMANDKPTDNIPIKYKDVWDKLKSIFGDSISNDKPTDI